jgi:hypothetical protein
MVRSNMVLKHMLVASGVSVVWSLINGSKFAKNLVAWSVLALAPSLTKSVWHRSISLYVRPLVMIFVSLGNC